MSCKSLHIDSSLLPEDSTLTVSGQRAHSVTSVKEYCSSNTAHSLTHNSPRTSRVRTVRRYTPVSTYTCKLEDSEKLHPSECQSNLLKEYVEDIQMSNEGRGELTISDRCWEGVLCWIWVSLVVWVLHSAIYVRETTFAPGSFLTKYRVVRLPPTKSPSSRSVLR